MTKTQKDLYNKLKEPFEAAYAKEAGAGDAAAQIKAFLKKLNDKFSLDQIEKLKPFIIAFVDEKKAVSSGDFRPTHLDPDGQGVYVGVRDDAGTYPTTSADGTTKPLTSSDLAQFEVIGPVKAIPSKKPANTGENSDVDESDSRIHKFSSTQVNLPPATAKQVLALGKNLIPDSDLYTDPADPSYGREENPHITVRWGLHTENADDVKKIFDGEKAFSAKLGKVSIFPGGEDSDYDVVKVDVDSPDLHRLYKLVGDNTKVTTTFPDYTPHVTLAYVKKGKGARYVGNKSLEGTVLKFDAVTFSSKNGDMVDIPLKKTTSEERFAEQKQGKKEKEEKESKADREARERKEELAKLYVPVEESGATREQLQKRVDEAFGLLREYRSLTDVMDGRTMEQREADRPRSAELRDEIADLRRKTQEEWGIVARNYLDRRIQLEGLDSPDSLTRLGDLYPASVAEGVSFAMTVAILNNQFSDAQKRVLLEEKKRQNGEPFQFWDSYFGNMAFGTSLAYNAKESDIYAIYDRDGKKIDKAPKNDKWHSSIGTTDANVIPEGTREQWKAEQQAETDKRLGKTPQGGLFDAKTSEQTTDNPQNGPEADAEPVNQSDSTVQNDAAAPSIPDDFTDAERQYVLDAGGHNIPERQQKAVEDIRRAKDDPRFKYTVGDRVIAQENGKTKKREVLIYGFGTDGYQILIPGGSGGGTVTHAYIDDVFQKLSPLPQFDTTQDIHSFLIGNREKAMRDLGWTVANIGNRAHIVKSPPNGDFTADLKKAGYEGPIDVKPVAVEKPTTSTDRFEAEQQKAADELKAKYPVGTELIRGEGKPWTVIGYAENFGGKGKLGVKLKRGSDGTIMGAKELAERFTVQSEEEAAEIGGDKTVFTTPGTNVKWSTVSEWIAGNMEIHNRHISSTRHEQEKAHVDALLENNEIIADAKPSELVRLRNLLNLAKPAPVFTEERAVYTKLFDLISAAENKPKVAKSASTGFYVDGETDHTARVEDIAKAAIAADPSLKIDDAENKAFDALKLDSKRSNADIAAEITKAEPVAQNAAANEDSQTDGANVQPKDATPEKLASNEVEKEATSTDQLTKTDEKDGKVDATESSTDVKPGDLIEFELFDMKPRGTILEEHSPTMWNVQTRERDRLVPKNKVLRKVDSLIEPAPEQFDTGLQTDLFGNVVAPPKLPKPPKGEKIETGTLFDMSGLDEEGLFAQGGPKPINADEAADTGKADTAADLLRRQAEAEHRLNVEAFGDEPGSWITEIAGRNSSPAASAVAKTLIGKRQAIIDHGGAGQDLVADIVPAMLEAAEAETRGLTFDDYIRQSWLGKEDLSPKQIEGDLRR